MISKDYLAKLMEKTNNKLSSVDKIPSSLLRDIQQCAINEILDIINCSLKTGIFPQSLKTSHVIPAIKDTRKEQNCYTNYRPISSLSFLSKLIEKCILDPTM